MYGAESVSNPFFHAGSGLSGSWFCGPRGDRMLQINQTMIPGREALVANRGVVQLSEKQWRALAQMFVAHRRGVLAGGFLFEITEE